MRHTGNSEQIPATGMTMTNNTLKTTMAALALGVFISGCASGKSARMFDHANATIRAAQNAGAQQHAPDPYERSRQTYHKALAAFKQRRKNRAQKLLDLATAQASLAKAISEAEQAEASLSYINTGLAR